MKTALRRLVGQPVLWYRSRLNRSFEKATVDIKSTQQACLTQLLKQVSGSKFAKDFSMGSNLSLTDLRRTMPVAGYDRMRPYIDQVAAGDQQALFHPSVQIKMMAETSGTTASIKLIPVTGSCLANYRRSWNIWGVAMARQHPWTAHGDILQLTSPWQGRKTPGGSIPQGSISGFLTMSMRSATRLTSVVPPDVANLQDSDLRRQLILRLALRKRDLSLIITANPSTLIQFGRQLQEHAASIIRDMFDGTYAGGPVPSREINGLASLKRPDRRRARALEAILTVDNLLVPARAWSDLSLLGVWTGGSLSRYSSLLTQLYGEVPRRDHGLSASEGRITIPFADGTDVGVLNAGNGVFEFIPQSSYGAPNPETFWPEQLEVGKEYVVVVSTTGGLWRYNMGDLVRCRGFLGTTPLLSFVSKVAHITSLTGEKLSAMQVDQSLKNAGERLGTSFELACLTPVWGDPPGYFLMLPKVQAATIRQTAQLSKVVEEELRQSNIEYASKSSSSRLHPVRVAWLEEAIFDQLQGHLVGPNGSHLEQYKHPVLLTEADRNRRLGKDFAQKFLSDQRVNDQSDAFDESRGTDPEGSSKGRAKKTRQGVS